MIEDWRLFIALPILPKLRTGFFNLVKSLEKKGGDVKWVEEDNFHITLKFLGETHKSKIPSIEKAMEESLASFNSFRVKFQELGAFPNLKRPRVLWVGVQRGGEEMKNIAKELENRLLPLGFKKESKEFSPHLTIGRVKSPQFIDSLIEEIKRIKDFDGGGMNAHQIHLMKSQLTSRGAIYSVVRSFPLPHREPGEELPEEYSGSNTRLTSK